MRLIVTRPAAQAMPWVAALQALGLDALALPLIGIEPPGATRPSKSRCQAPSWVCLNVCRAFLKAPMR